MTHSIGRWCIASVTTSNDYLTSLSFAFVRASFKRSAA